VEHPLTQDTHVIPLSDTEIEPWSQPHCSSVASEYPNYMQETIYSFGPNTAIHHDQMIVEEDTTFVSSNEISDGKGCSLTPLNLKRYCGLCLGKLTRVEDGGRKPNEVFTTNSAERGH